MRYVHLVIYYATCAFIQNLDNVAIFLQTKSIEKTKNELSDAETALHDVQKKIQNAQVRREAIDSELENIDQKIRDARDEYKKSKDETRLMESIKALQRHFPGELVYWDIF
jgi:peptidoglycan hydrolase CwlO-like protein